MTKSHHEKVTPDIFWLKDARLEETENLPDHNSLSRDIAEKLGDILDKFRNNYNDLKKQ